EESFMEPYEDSYKYWKNPDGTMHVPKRDLDDIIFKIF
ncbi:MAG: nitroreductase, partial [Promethearchaeota archaeon Loki_b31]